MKTVIRTYGMVWFLVFGYNNHKGLHPKWHATSFKNYNLFIF